MAHLKLSRTEQVASLKAVALSLLNMAHFLALESLAEKALLAETLTKQGHAQALLAEILTNGSTSLMRIGFHFQIRSHSCTCCMCICTSLYNYACHMI